MQQTKFRDSCKPYMLNYLQGWFNVKDLEMKKGLDGFFFCIVMMTVQKIWNSQPQLLNNGSISYSLENRII